MMRPVNATRDRGAASAQNTVQRPNTDHDEACARAFSEGWDDDCFIVASKLPTNHSSLSHDNSDDADLERALAMSREVIFVERKRPRSARRLGERSPRESSPPLPIENKHDWLAEQRQTDSCLAYFLQIEELALVSYPGPTPTAPPSPSMISSFVAGITRMLGKRSTESGSASEGLLISKHAEMLQVLQPENGQSLIGRIGGLFGTIMERYNKCSEENQALIRSLRPVSDLVLPQLLNWKVNGAKAANSATTTTSKTTLSKAALLTGLMTFVMRGELTLADGQRILAEMAKLWGNSAAWYEFLEQLVYILLAVTLPSIYQLPVLRIFQKTQADLEQK